MHDRIRQQRKKLKMNQEQLAIKAGITQATISAIELNKNEASYKTVAKIAKALDVSTDYLILGTANKPTVKEFSKQQLELIELTEKMTDQEQSELLGAVKMYLSTHN